MIKDYSLKALQKALNHALALDPTSKEKMLALQGKMLELIITPLGVNFFIAFEDGRLQFLSHYQGQPDTIIHSSPLGLIRLSLLPASRARSLFNDKIRISGDVELGQNIKRLFDELDIDWEGHLSYFTGDVVAHQLGSLFRRGLAFKRHVDESMQANITEYLQEELRVLPSREEVDDFFNDIDTLVLDVERMQEKYNQLMDGYEID